MGLMYIFSYPMACYVKIIMERMRDHSIKHPWLIVIINECLSVQNKEALQTEEA
jgi:hypothetical protein